MCGCWCSTAAYIRTPRDVDRVCGRAFTRRFERFGGLPQPRYHTVANAAKDDLVLILRAHVLHATCCRTGHWTRWLEGCPCHEHLLVSCTSYEERRAILIENGVEGGDLCEYMLCSSCRCLLLSVPPPSTAAAAAVQRFCPLKHTSFYLKHVHRTNVLEDSNP